jgi:hypothetical protein
VAEDGLAVALKISLKRSARLTSRSVAPFHLITVINDKVIEMKLAPASSVRGDIEDDQSRAEPGVVRVAQLVCQCTPEGRAADRFEDQERCSVAAKV